MIAGARTARRAGRGGRWVHPALLAPALALVLAFALPPFARAKGDPASDYLLVAPVFYPFQPRTAPALREKLERTLAQLGAKGLKLKVAIIGSAIDLGAVPDLFGRPQDYAEFLEPEISFNETQPLLVVMPAGFGLSHVGPKDALDDRSWIPCRRGRDHNVDSSTKETTSTMAAAQANSQAGTGRLARPEMPWALAAGGTAAAAHSKTTVIAAARRAAAETADPGVGLPFDDIFPLTVRRKRQKQHERGQQVRRRLGDHR